ncbi:MAG TPA: type II toxin-antitoxin system VapB family antitoxin [Caulobacteraceae bacterium]|nr:type II toxin-antitoxin system VapB family antitoxin [Caulobacteraceae bacterium]
MNDAPIQIRNPEVVRAIRALAQKTGRPITETVATAVDAELKRRDVLGDEERKRKLRAMRDIVARIQQLPIIGPDLTDDDLYDEDGLPK